MNSVSNDLLERSEELLDKSRGERGLLLQEPLAALVQDFITQWLELYPRDGERAARFLSAASQLLEWKALMLLPPLVQLVQGFEEELTGLTLAQAEHVELEELRSIILLLAERNLEQQQMLRRNPLPPGALQADSGGSLQQVSLSDLHHAFSRIVMRLLAQVDEEPVQIRGELVSRQVCLSWLEQTLREHQTIRLEELFRVCPPQRSYWVVVFLLLLEMVHQQQVLVALLEDGEISITMHHVPMHLISTTGA